ncbi:hypothetical protein ZIOFF_042670 [Zingiber officinale]|uniref:Neprosin PEP catalytic domain-containing protein n=1 Tax=Zingiber officinale TaxID=94328 RepID=A0A8J5FXS9_ZINOF|nr:hypothetical protein ZIOFF_042670 [Zingiber officinale]
MENTLEYYYHYSATQGRSWKKEGKPSIKTIQLKPSFLPNGLKPAKPKPATFYGFNDTCPSGTILIERSQKSDYFRSHPVDEKTESGDYFAIIETNTKGPNLFYGASARMTTHLFSLLPTQVSASSIFLFGGAHGPRYDLNVIEAGWHYSPNEYNDYVPRFFTYWTRDGYSNSGCGNLRCPGFVRTTSSPIGPGSPIKDFSVYGGEEVSFSLQIYKDPSTSNWWFLLQGESIGYYPRELLPNMDGGIDKIQMGGRVFSFLKDPSPPMGSGHPYYEGRNKAAYFTQVQLIDPMSRLYNIEPQFLNFISDLPDYYGIGDYHLANPNDGYVFAYGGLGGFRK